MENLGQQPMSAPKIPPQRRCPLSQGQSKLTKISAKTPWPFHDL